MFPMTGRKPYFYRPLAGALFGQIGGILLGGFFPGYLWYLIAATLVVTVGILFCIRQRRSSLWLPMALMMLAGWISIQPVVAPELPVNHISHHADGDTHTLTGLIVSEPKHLTKRVRMKVKVERIHSLDGFTPASGYLRLTIGVQPAGRLRRGDRIRFSGRLKPVHGFTNPNGFDYRRYLIFQGIHCRLWSAADQVKLVEPGVQKGFWRAVDQLREKVGRRLDETASEGSGPILKALIIGDRSGMDWELRRIFARCGVAHILAISGLHVAIVASVIFLPLFRLLGFFPPLLRKGAVMKTAALFTIPVVMVYGIMTGLSPSTQRAVLMVSVFLLALLVDRWQEPFNTLAVAALVMLAIDPAALFAVAFQLSFAAVAVIFWGERLWTQLKTTTVIPEENRLHRYGWGLLRVSVFAYLGTLPLAAHYFNEVSLIAVAVNALAVPIIGYGIVPLGLSGLGLYLFSDAAASWVWGTTGGFLEMILKALTALANLEFSATFLVTPNWLEIGLYYALLISSSLLSVNALLALRGRNESLNRNVKRYQYVFIAALALGVVDGGYWYYQRHLRSTMRATILDVGNGSANLVELPQGKVMLIDGGGFTDSTIFDVGRSIVAPALWAKKINRIDYLVLSHPNSDHLNGLLFIARHFHIGEVWQTGLGTDTQGFLQFRQILSHRNLPTPAWIDLPKTKHINNVTVDILWPPTKEGTPVKWPDINNQSLVLKLTHGRHSILFPGDVERPVEMALIRLHKTKLSSTFLVAPHHGSRTSSSQLFLEAVSPRAVIVSSAPWGRYPFPHPVVRERYRRLGLTVLGTAQQGAVTIDFKKNGFLVKTEKTPST